MKTLIVLVRILSAFVVVATLAGCAFQVEAGGHVSGSIGANGGRHHRGFSPQGPQTGYHLGQVPQMDTLHGDGYQRGGGELVFARWECVGGRMVLHRQYRVRRSVQVWGGGSTAPVCSPHRRCN